MTRARFLVLIAAALLLTACDPEVPDGPGVLPDTPVPATPGPGTAPEEAPGESPGPADDAGADTAEADGAGEAEPVEVGITVVAEGLRAPWDVAFTPDGRVFVTERDSGRLLELSGDGQVGEVQTFPVDASGEGGLLGLAASPEFEDDGLLYAYYTTSEDNRIVRFAPGEEPEVVLAGIPRASNHNGGRVAFGPDGMLYAGTGDAAQAGAAQDPSSLAGKVLRLTPDGEVPEDNPEPGSPVYAMGLRNVQGLAWAPDGTLYAAEFGPDRDDEVNRIEPGANYGWPEVTGAAGVEGYVDPVFVAQPPEASWSGLAALVGGAVPQWEGDLFATGLRGQRLWRLTLDDGGDVAEAEELYVQEFGRLRQAAQAPDGSLWVLTSNRDGRGDPAPTDDHVLRLGPSS